MIAAKELYWMQFSLRSKEPCAVSMHRKKVYAIYYPTTLYAYTVDKQSVQDLLDTLNARINTFRYW